jgi:hypothetical protein
LVKKVIKKQRDKLISTKMKNSSATTFWKTVNEITGRSSSIDEMAILSPDGLSFINPEQLPQAFGDFFLSKVQKLVDQNPIEDEPVTLTYTGLSPFTIQEIKDAVSSFQPKRSAGPDEIPMAVFKHGLETLEPYIKKLFDNITTRGKIPWTWKTARLKPIHKKGDRSKIDNFRPISNLNSISKIFERCLLNRLSSLDTDGINQHGFRAGHSTVTAGLEIQGFIAEELSVGKYVAVYSVDLSAAFDLIRPGIFVKKALKVIPDHNIVHFMHDFITERKGFVEINQWCSETLQFKVGCPQGSTLGPKVFNIYCSDLIESITFGKLVSFADDSYVVVSAPSMEQLVSSLKLTLVSHLGWLSANGMICNIEKTELMFMQSDVEPPDAIEISDRKIKVTNSFKVLGVMFDSKLDWTLHVNQVTAKTNRIMYALKKIRRFLNTSQANQVVTSFYFSVLYYGMEIWFHKHLMFHLKQKVRAAHYRALRLIHGQHLERNQLDAIAKRATPDEWSDYCVAKTLAKLVILEVPVRLKDMVMVNSYAERRKANRLFFFDSSKKKIGRQSFRNRLSVIAKQMKFEWTLFKVSSLRTALKKCFFNYALNQ